ncbi:MAG: hypothetical protein AAFV53_12620 [Myxococcota bacterium]
MSRLSLVRAMAFVVVFACTTSDPRSPGEDADTDIDTDTDVDVFVPPTTAEQLETFYASVGGRDRVPAHQVRALEALLAAQDTVAAGDLDGAQAIVDGIFEEMPVSDPIWDRDIFWEGTNLGHPVAYYGLRMLQTVLSQGDLPAAGTLTMTVVVATCADVTRPTLPDLRPETVRLEIDPRILANDAYRLHMVTALFRRWVYSITGGYSVELAVHQMTECATVDYTDDGSVIVSYPDSGQMVESVPEALAEKTDLWWVVAPSGVPGDGSGYNRHFITGGMGGVGALPLFLSDDAWFTRKPEHLGAGDYTEAELRAYQPQWFQHEFMHHLYRTWPAFGLEEQGHQWFDRSTWPDDFVGVWEPDYYSESIHKRLLTATPSMADTLQAPAPVDVDAIERAAFVGEYERQPVQNDWHVTRVAVNGEELTWTNAAGVSWGMEIRDGGLWTREDCPYGVQELQVELEDDVVSGLWFGGERYTRTQ